MSLCILCGATTYVGITCITCDPVVKIQIGEQTGMKSIIYNGRMGEVESLSRQRWPMEYPSPDNYRSLYDHHEKLIDLLQFLLWWGLYERPNPSGMENGINIEKEDWGQGMNDEILCHICDDPIPGIPNIRDDEPVCRSCLRDIYLNLPGKEGPS